MQKGKVWARLSLVMVAVLMVGGILACGPAEVTPQVEKEEVYIHNFGDYTGPYALVVHDMLRGQVDFVKWTNERGGIEGHQIKFVWADDNNVLARSMAIYRQYLASEHRPVILIIGSTPVGEMLTPMAEEEKLVLCQYGGGSEAQLFPPRNTWLLSPNYGANEIANITWYLENRYTGEGKMKVGNICVDDPYGRATNDIVERYAQETGAFEFVGVEFTSQLAADLTPQWSNMRERDVDLVYGQGVAGGPMMSALFRDRLKLGYTDIAVGLGWPINVELIQATVGSEATEGVFTGNHVYMPDEADEPGVKLAYDIASEFRPGFEPTVSYMMGLLQGEWVVEAARRAIEAKGSVDLTDEDVMASFKTMKGFAGQGFSQACGGPVNENDRQLCTWVRMSGAKEGKRVTLSDWIEVKTEVIAPPEFRNLLQ